MISVEKLENYINKEEIFQPRTPKEYVLWFEGKLKIIKERGKELKKQILLHEGVSKYFHEELFPHGYGKIWSIFCAFEMGFLSVGGNLSYNSS